MTPRQQAIAFFVGQGWTPAQAAGIVANLEAESGLRPNAVGDSGLAYGLAQWHPDRQANFERLIGKQIKGSSFEDQLAFVNVELRGPERSAGDALASCVTAAESGACVSKRYERPADQEGEAVKRAALAERIFKEATASTGDPVKPTGATMGPLALLQLFGPILSGMLPQIAPLLNPGSKAEKYAGVAQVVLDTINTATGQPNLQGSIEAMQADPAVKTAVQAAVVTQPQIIETLTVSEIGGGGIGGAREANLASALAPDLHWWTQIMTPVFFMSIALCAMLIMVLGNVLGMPWGGSFQEWSENTRSNVVFAIITGSIGAITGYWFGTTTSSNRKDSIIAAQSGVVDK